MPFKLKLGAARAANFKLFKKQTNKQTPPLNSCEGYRAHVPVCIMSQANAISELVLHTKLFCC